MTGKEIVKEIMSLRKQSQSKQQVKWGKAKQTLWDISIEKKRNET